MADFLTLNVLVIGAGPAGLTTAIGLRKAGHKVTILERSSCLNAFGAAVVIGPTATKILKYYAIDFEEMRATEATSAENLAGDNLQVLSLVTVPKALQYFATRADLAVSLTANATGSDSNLAGPPVEIIYNSKVIRYDALSGRVDLNDGTSKQADLIIAANGVHSSAVEAVLGKPYSPNPSRTSIIRFMLPKTKIASNPETAPLVAHPGRFSFYMSPDKKRYLVTYPAQNNELLNCGMYVITPNDTLNLQDASDFNDKPSTSSHEQASQERNEANPEQEGAESEPPSKSRSLVLRSTLQSTLSDFHSSIQALCPKTAPTLSVWHVQDRSPLPSWHNKRLLLIGDAAHPMLPNLGQGAGQGIEDGAVLGILLSQIPTSTNDGPNDRYLGDEIEKRLALFEKVRYGRASVVQVLSSVPYFLDIVGVLREELKTYMPEEELPRNSDEVRPWLGRYDPLGHAERALEEYLAR